MKEMKITDEEEKSLKKYVNLLLQWNQKMNLIGKSTVDDIWNRHILDCGQLMNYLCDSEIENFKFADFGSGAGLPGIVLSILGVRNITLIEKSPLKCKFLEEAAVLSKNKINIINNNIFDIKDIKFDIIFSRALSNLSNLLVMVKPFLKSDSKCYFLKGKKVGEELEEAKKIFSFEYSLAESTTSPDGRVVEVKNIKGL